jgi:hypothetical protein
MSVDKPRKGDRGSAVSYVDHNDPLPECPEPETRWACPYISDKTSKPTVFTRRPLTPAEVAYGLKSCLVADDLARLAVLMKHEDDKHEEYLRSLGRSIR